MFALKKLFQLKHYLVVIVLDLLVFNTGKRNTIQNLAISLGSQVSPFTNNSIRLTCSVVQVCDGF